MLAKTGAVETMTESGAASGVKEGGNTARMKSYFCYSYAYAYSPKQTENVVN